MIIPQSTCNRALWLTVDRIDHSISHFCILRQPTATGIVPFLPPPLLLLLLRPQENYFAATSTGGHAFHAAHVLFLPGRPQTPLEIDEEGCYSAVHPVVLPYEMMAPGIAYSTTLLSSLIRVAFRFVLRLALFVHSLIRSVGRLIVSMV